jgi:hypothetical protein
MKKTLMALIMLAMFVGSAEAQFLNQGAIVGSGSISFYSGKNKQGGSSGFEETVTTVSLEPWAGYFVIDNLGVGLSVNLSSEKFEVEGSSAVKSSALTLGPVIRFYPTDGIFLQGYFGFGNEKVDFGSGENKESLTEWIAGAGYSFRISESVLLDPMLGYWSRNHSDSDATSTRFCITIGFTIILKE